MKREEGIQRELARLVKDGEYGVNIVLTAGGIWEYRLPEQTLPSGRPLAVCGGVVEKGDFILTLTPLVQGEKLSVTEVTNPDRLDLGGSIPLLVFIKTAVDEGDIRGIWGSNGKIESFSPFEEEELLLFIRMSVGVQRFSLWGEPIPPVLTKLEERGEL